MTPNEYQQKALVYNNPFIGDKLEMHDLLNGLMGLNGEAGEAIDVLKKYLFQGHEFDREHLARELGDVAWYLALCSDAIGYGLEDIFQMNLDKLANRYPNGYQDSYSVNRAEDDI